MNIGRRGRWTACAIAAGMTAAAMIWVDRQDDTPPAVEAAPPSAPEYSAPAPATASTSPSISPRNLDASAPTPARPQAPPVPFRYLGKWTEGGRTTVLLMREGRSIAITATGRLDDQYAVQAIDEDRVVLQYLPSGATQVVPFDAPPTNKAQAVAPPPAAPPAAAPADDPDQLTN
jgi:hypothetical protein